MTEDRDPTRGRISGTISAEERRADIVANANQDTVQSKAVREGLEALRRSEEPW